jgi:predicted dehydrogenase
LYAKACFETYLPEWHPWEDYRQSYAARGELGGGVLPTLDHEIDFLNWCLGTPQSAAGRSWNSGTLGIEADDTAILTVDYPGGVAATFSLSMCRRDKSRGFELVGENGTLRFSFERSHLELVCGTAETLWHEPDYDLNEMYLTMLKANLDALARGAPPPTPLSAGLDAARVCAVIR